MGHMVHASQCLAPTKLTALYSRVPYLHSLHIHSFLPQDHVGLLCFVLCGLF